MSAATGYTHRRTALAARLVAGLVGVAALLMAGPADAQRGAPPAGAEIARRARAARLDRANAAVGQFSGKRITLVPADAATLTDVALAAGQVIGVMTTQVAGDETGLPPGTYNLFAARLDDGWHVYAESGGRVVKEALRVRIERLAATASPAGRKPRFREKGWGWDVVCCEDALDGGGSGGGSSPPPVAVVRVVPGEATLPLGASEQIAVSVLAADGTALTSRAVTWTSSNPAVVGAFGVGGVRAVAPGTASVIATSEGVTGGAAITVAPPEAPAERLLEGSMAVSGAWSVPVTRTTQLQATAVFRNCSLFSPCPRVDYAALVWTSSDSAIATVRPSAPGSPYAIVTGVGEGQAEITARYAPGSVPAPYTGVSPYLASGMRVRITPAPASTVVVAPTPVRIPAGSTRQMSATVRDPNGAVLQRPVTWSSSDATVANVSASGLVVTTATGSATITATSEGTTGGAAVIVDPVLVGSVIVTPSPSSVATGATIALTANVRDAAGHALTGRAVTWTTSNPTIASVAPDGVVTGAGAGAVTVTAMSEGKSGVASLNVVRAKKGGGATTAASTMTLSFDW